MLEMNMTDVKTVADPMGIFFIDNRLLVFKPSNDYKLPYKETVEALKLNVIACHIDAGMRVVSCVTPLNKEAIQSQDYGVYDVRRALVRMQPEEHYQVLKNFHWLNWNRQSQYCGECGKPLEVIIDSTEKKCFSCKKSFFPRFSPAVMVLVYSGNKVLLARSSHFPAGDYSAVAGFIDVGETAEQAAHREVKEELGIDIDNLTYFSTQTWPFPDSFMIAFTARYAGGELKIDPEEIEDARWFTKDDLPDLTPSVSIARTLLRHFVEDIYSIA